MSNSNIQKFRELAQSDSALKSKVQAARTDFLEKLVQISNEAGFHCKVEDFATAADELDEVDLDKASGGAWYPSDADTLPPK